MIKKDTWQYWLFDTVTTVVVIVILVLTIQHTLVAPFDVVGPSMCNTLNYLDDECESGKGEKILINVAKYFFADPQRGEVVVFKSPADKSKYLVKRIIAEPGEVVSIEDGEVYVTGVEGERFLMDEPYLNEVNSGNTKVAGRMFTFPVVPEGHYFVMGDNRANSSDSRSCFNRVCDEEGAYFLSKDLIRGEAWVVFWPLSSWRTVNGS